MADWDFLDEVDVLAKLSGDFKEKLESKKWQERKEALEQLQGLLANNPRLSTKANYGEIVNTMQLVCTSIVLCVLTLCTLSGSR